MIFDDDPSDEVMHRLDSLVKNNPIHKKARANRLAYEQKIDDRFLANPPFPPAHPFEYDPKKPSLHP